MIDHSSKALTGLGISLEPLRAELSSVSSSPDSSCIPNNKLDAPGERGALPPLLLVPRFSGEPFRLEISSPRHPRGTGEIWPPESAIRQGGSHDLGPNLPIALLWSALARDPMPQWAWTTPEKESRTATPAEAIAGACAALVPSLLSGDVSPVLVIPNHIQMSKQQALIDACRQLGLHVKLLWRPVAAALSWCKQHADAVIEQHHNGDGSIGSLLSVHLGLDEFEIASLELVVQRSGDKRWLVPARRRPTVGALPSFGIDWLMETGLGAVNAAWHKLWMSNSIRDTALNRGLTLDDFLNRTRKSDWRQQTALNDWLPETNKSSSFDGWLRKNANALDTRRTLGVVVTGELAEVSFTRHVPLWLHVLQAQRVPATVSRVSVESLRSGLADHSTRSEPMIGGGAALHSSRLTSKEPSYLDTLPRIRTSTYIAGRPAWLDLLKPDDGWVDGGRTWQRSDPLRGLCIQEGRSELEVIVWHDEFPTVRKLKSSFKQPLTKDIPVRLEIAVEPAQGNARIEVIPLDPNCGLRQLRLEWSRMEDTKLVPDEFLGKLPTLFPPLLRRASCRAKWENAREAMRLYLSGGLYRSLSSVIATLQQRDEPDVSSADIEVRATAISSDGEPSELRSEILERFVSAALSRLLVATGKESEEVVRVLGYTSTGHPKFQEYLAARVRTGSYLERHELSACGWCLRESSDIAAFAALFAKLLRSYQNAMNNWLKAFAEMLRYREDATQDITSRLCEELTERILVIFREEHAKRSFKFLFRNSCLCIVYLLRRRAYDDDYLALGSPLHAVVRSAFIRARDDMAKKGIGGAIKLDRALQTMIDFIDCKGPPLLAAGTGFQELTE